jgi:hypothetical protein
MDPTTLAHAGGLDELAIILFPAFVGFGVWLLTRQANPPKKNPTTRVNPSDNRSWTHPADHGH